MTSQPTPSEQEPHAADAPVDAGTDIYVFEALRTQRDRGPSFLTNELAELATTDAELARHLPAIADYLSHLVIDYNYPLKEALEEMAIIVHRAGIVQTVLEATQVVIPDNLDGIDQLPPRPEPPDGPIAA
jgi:hypothetical protein